MRRLLLAAATLVLLCPGTSAAEETWEWPLSPRPPVARVFEAPPGPYAPGHRGVDLLGRAGQRVLAVAAGTVSFTGRVGGVGVVSLDTAAGRVTYQPLAASVGRGTVVRPGEVLGVLTTMGSHCLPQPCLHLGLLVGGEYRDPLRMLAGGPVRLLPVDGLLTPVTGLPPPAPPSAPGPAPVPSAAAAAAALALGL